VKSKNTRACAIRCVKKVRALRFVRCVGWKLGFMVPVRDVRILEF